ncbi:hypothetical protein GPX89_06850 [Nocardia sp. ET3-3]|uniref:DoxX family protein n=1 Tax=Nocardia terrae TaxID=2675851 RepID=A0A7K1URI8_9NOCA|nr:hypothetical protein [Nocardia terrae]MVU76963.1 hypothetical protein [Nocardia terrae]
MIALAASAAVAAAAATVAELTLGLGMIVGFRTHYVAAAMTLVLTTFALAMATSVGIGSMLSYAVPFLVAAAATIEVTGPGRGSTLPATRRERAGTPVPGHS